MACAGGQDRFLFKTAQGRGRPGSMAAISRNERRLVLVKGDKRGDNGIIKLWKMMYDRFTNYHHLNNLLWVWGANGLRDIPKDEAYHYGFYYPGAEYVDILGADVYNSDYEQSDYNELVELAKGKIIALTEVGELPKPEILQAQPKWAWFLVWTSWLWTNNPQGRAKEIYSLPQTLNQDEVKKKMETIR